LIGFADVQAWLEPKLVAAGYNPLPVFDPGPGPNLDAQDVDPNMLVIVSPWPGGGLTTEELFDQGAVQIRAVGPQNDYDTAEQLARDCDKGMISFDLSQRVNGKWWLSVTRAGGSPALLLQDQGDRFQFYCNYIVEVEYA